MVCWSRSNGTGSSLLRKDIKCLELASELAFLNGDEGYGVSLIMDAIKRAFMKLNWPKARALMKQVRKLQYLNVQIDVHEAIMQSYKTRSTLDLFLAWLKEEGNNGTSFPSFDKEYDASYYEALCEDVIIDTQLTKDVMFASNIAHFDTCYELAKAVTCPSKKMQLEHVARALNIAFEDERRLAEKGAKHGVRSDDRFFIYLLTTLGRKPTQEPNDDNIYEKTNFSVSQSIRAYLCFGVLDWILNYSNALAIEEETLLTELVLNLLPDAVNDTTVYYENKFIEIDKLAQKFTDFICSPDYNAEKPNEYMREMEKLKNIEKRFKEERVSIPNPSIIFSMVCSVIDELHDDGNKFQLLNLLRKLTEKIEPLKLEENLLTKLDRLRDKVKDLTLENGQNNEEEQ